MILYYTATQKTKVFAEALAEVKQLPVCRLKSKLGERVNFGFIVQSLFYTLAGKPYPTDSLPDLAGIDEIYLCSPVWGGKVASPVLYFLQQCDLKGKTVHVLLTCDSISHHDKYTQKAQAALAQTACTPGNVHVFATQEKSLPEKDVLIGQIREMNV